MVSFRLSDEEYDRCTLLLREYKIGNLSALARAALEVLAASQPGEDPLSDEVHELRRRVRSMSVDVAKLAEQIDGHEAAASPTVAHTVWVAKSERAG